MTRPNAASGRPRRQQARPVARADLAHEPAPPPATPLPAELLERRAAEIRELVEELTTLTRSQNAWALRVVRRNVALALANPGALGSAENQMDFIDALAEAVWDAADPGLVRPLAAAPASTDEMTRAREARRRALLARLDELTDHLCQAVERWRDSILTAAGEAPRRSPRYPQ